jgi:hypothetical protein
LLHQTGSTRDSFDFAPANQESLLRVPLTCTSPHDAVTQSAIAFINFTNEVQLMKLWGKSAAS